MVLSHSERQGFDLVLKSGLHLVSVRKRGFGLVSEERQGFVLVSQ